MGKSNKLIGRRDIKLKFIKSCDFDANRYLFSARVDKSPEVFPVKIGKIIKIKVGDIADDATSFNITLYATHNPIDGILGQATFPVLVKDYNNTNEFKVCIIEEAKTNKIIISGGLP